MNIPLCNACHKPATCYGTYSGVTQYSCDTCCGHGNEDGHCERFAASVETLFPAKQQPTEDSWRCRSDGSATLTAAKPTSSWRTPEQEQIANLNQLRSEVEVSPVRCNCGGVGVICHDSKDKIRPHIIRCIKCAATTNWLHTMEEVVTKWATMNAPPKPEPDAETELLPCPMCKSAMEVAEYGNYKDFPWRVDCSNRICPVASKACASRSRAVSEWNRRAALEAKP